MDTTQYHIKRRLFPAPLLWAMVLWLCWPSAHAGTDSHSRIELLALESEPIAFRENGILKGFYVDILREFGRRLGAVEEVKAVPFPRLV